MSDGDPVGRVTDRIWSWLLGGLVFVVLLQLLVSLVVHLLPVLVLAGILAGALWWWRALRRW